ncbi:MAG: NAD(P)/FAD-dependent oxidoreductase [Dehalococcoidales bacterium]|nr:NAD(P)/FAD-dependent oxidoreductase [Dehalococcoidales bacterium]
MSKEADIVVIGAGVMGLAIAAEVSCAGKRVYVFEKNRTFGLETSSRNSEVIHAGLYYPENSLKAKFCVAGNPLLYALCEKYGVGHKRLGKVIVAANAEETREVERLYRQGIKNGVMGLRMLSQDEVKRLEPNVSAVAGLLSLSTGVVDSYNLMRSFYGRAKESGAEFVFNAEVIGIVKKAGGYEVSVKDREGISSITSGVMINAAGLFSDRVAQMAGIDVEKAGYKIHYCKGEYFSLNPKVGRLVNRLVYPVPEQAGIGVHITLSLDGGMRLGPNVKYVDTIDYTVDETSKADFYRAAHRYLPAIEPDDLAPDFAGVRPKLQGRGESFRDFVIRDEADKGLPGLINLIGIESPGLTSSPAIARYVAGIAKESLG